ncbi:MAG: tRNA lysidine(34) synthetase TilS, partial [Oscillospiraceae bacterium]|nr:tRNA lysidine(34) synthetase TilS [Oscillospiraceae bacterium]
SRGWTSQKGPPSPPGCWRTPPGRWPGGPATRCWKAGLGGEAVHLDAILELAGGEDPSARLDVPGGSVRRQYDLLVFSAGPEPEPPPSVELAEGENRWGDWSIRCDPAVCPEKAYISPWEFYLKADPYLIRPRREGDRITLGKRPEKTVKRLMIESRIPAFRRGLVPVLAQGERVAAVGGFGPEKVCLAAPGAPALHSILKGEENEL